MYLLEVTFPDLEGPHTRGLRPFIYEERIWCLGIRSISITDDQNHVLVAVGHSTYALA